ncbi:MAG: ATP-binding cassette domain-containing protein [Chlorobi bacterium]|nr:ATP-binding cassette domain-containing protein [Chlorobiota bacterium]
MASGNFLLRLEEVSFGYKRSKPVIKNLSWTVRQGDLWLLKGPNASGKSTLLKLITGVLKPNSGKIHCSEQWENRAVLLDVTGFIPSVTVMTQMVAYAKMFNGDAEHSLQQMNIPQEFWYKKFSELSAGMRQRARLSILFLKRNPEVIIIDEPFKDLDKDGISLFIDHMKKWYNDGKTIIMCAQAEEGIGEIFDIKVPQFPIGN